MYHLELTPGSYNPLFYSFWKIDSILQHAHIFQLRTLIIRWGSRVCTAINIRSTRANVEGPLTVRPRARINFIAHGNSRVLQERPLQPTPLDPRHLDLRGEANKRTNWVFRKNRENWGITCGTLSPPVSTLSASWKLFFFFRRVVFSSLRQLFYGRITKL